MEKSSYEDGMLSHEEYEEYSIVDSHFEFQAACIHEAGHAALSYLLGEGCSSVSLSVTYRRNSSGEPIAYAYGGLSMVSRQNIRKVNTDLRAGLYTTTLAKHGVSTAAGPASERKFRLHNQMPLRLMGATQGDRHRIYVIGRSLQQSKRSPVAFRRLVWWVALRLLENDVVWRGVEALAFELIDNSELSEDEDDSYVLAGAKARSILNGVGCRPTALNDIFEETFKRALP